MNSEAQGNYTQCIIRCILTDNSISPPKKSLGVKVRSFGEKFPQWEPEKAMISMPEEVLEWDYIQSQWGPSWWWHLAVHHDSLEEVFQALGSWTRTQEGRCWDLSRPPHLTLWEEERVGLRKKDGKIEGERMVVYSLRSWNEANKFTCLVLLHDNSFSTEPILNTY